MTPAYANTVSCYLPIFIPLRTIFILCTTFCNVKFNNYSDTKSPCFNSVLFSKNYDSVPPILTTLLVFCAHVKHIPIYLLIV